jgi:hypothetical protein
MMTASLGFHELGHILTIWSQGIEWEMGFGAVGAWTISPLKDRQVLGHYGNSLIHLAGPSFSFLFALIALGMFFIMDASADRWYWLLLANLNALLALVNFIPMGNLSDGGKFIKRLFSSLPEKEERRLLTMLVPSFFSWLALLYGLDLVRAASLGIVVLWLFISMLIEATQDDPSEAESPKAMTRQQAGVLASIVVMLFFLSTCIVIVTPFWLTEGAILKMAEGWIAFVANIILRSPISLRVGLAVVGILLLFRFARGTVMRFRAFRAQRFRN